VFSAYTPVAVAGVRWGLVAKVETTEIFAPAIALRNLILATGGAVALAVAVLAMILGASLTRPLARLIDAMRRLGKGNLAHRVPVNRADEVGRIATAFNQMAADLQETTVSRDYVNNILGSMTDAVLVVRPPDGSEDWRDAVVVTVNASACTLIGRQEAEIVGQRIGALIPEIASSGTAGGAMPLSFEELYRQGSLGAREVVYKIRDGREVPVLFSSALMREGDRGVGGIVWAAHDLTELKSLEARNVFIRETFGRYVSDEVVSALLNAPGGLRLGGEVRTVTILMSDLRGFTAMAERLSPEAVVGLLNGYLEAMVEIIMRWHGTINEILGDAILVIFGAPTSSADDAERAVACALQMQLELERFNAGNATAGLPGLEMGIGIHTGEVVVGNIGSTRRTKYAAVGTTVNLAGRIESYTTGGQVLVSEDTHRAVRAPLRVNGQMRIEPKGIRAELDVYDVGGIGAPYDVALAVTQEALVPVQPPIAISYAVLEGKHVGASSFSGLIVGLSRRQARIVSDQPLGALTNLKLSLLDTTGVALAGDIYGKVVAGDAAPGGILLRFTSVEPAIAKELDARLGA
jgi:adenylate cyclase